jgi:hypothetical protein
MILKNGEGSEMCLKTAERTREDQNEKKRDIAEEIARRRERLKKKRFIIPKRGDEKKEKKRIPLPADYYYG